MSLYTESNGELIDYSGKYIVHNDCTYFLLKKIGAGSFATVWLAYQWFQTHGHKELSSSLPRSDFANNAKQSSLREGKLIAMKIFPHTHTKDANIEYNISVKMAELNIPGIIQFYSIFEWNDENVVIITMELSVGSLYDVMKKISIGKTAPINFNNGFNIEFVHDVVYILLKTLNAMHSNNIAHCDVKPENILLCGQTLEWDAIKIQLDELTTVDEILDCIRKINSDDINFDDLHQIESDMESVLSDGTITNNIEVSSDIATSVSSQKNYEMTITIETLSAKNIRLGDLGSCVNLVNGYANVDTSKIVQTVYYKSPELLLGYNYTSKCDIWAVGCTAYELAIGELLFDSDNRNIDKIKCMLMNICDACGQIPADIINDAPYRDLYYDSLVIKKSTAIGDQQTTMPSTFWINFIKNILCGSSDLVSVQQKPPQSTNILLTKYRMAYAIIMMLQCNPTNRLTCEECIAMLDCSN